MSKMRHLEEVLMTRGKQVAPFVLGYLARWRPYKSSWNYEDGCIYKGFLDLGQVLGERSFVDFVTREVGKRVAADGAIAGFDANEYNIDNINAGKVLFPLLAHGGDARLRQAIERQHAQLDTHPRTATGNYWHKKIYPHQVWLDGLYMAQPFRSAYAAVNDRQDIRADILRQFGQVGLLMRDATSGLYYHGWDESRGERWSNRTTGCSPNFWGRAMGWFAMALVDCIELMPADAEPLKKQLREVAQGLRRVRSPAGLWWQVLDQGARSGNYEESSASLMIAYALMKGARLGVLESNYAALGRETLESAIARYLTSEALGGICGVAGLGGNPYRDGSFDYYISEPVVPNDPKGVGALLMALAESLQPIS